MPDWGGDARFTDLLRRRGDELVRVAVLVAGNRYDAEDAVQEAVLAVARSWAGVSERAAYAYLRQAVVRKAIDGRRRSSRSSELVDSPVDDAGFLRLESDREFFRLVQTLPPQQRAVLVLRYFDGADDLAIARTLQCSRSTVRSYAARGLARLREQSVASVEEER